MSSNPGASFANSWHFSSTQSETRQNNSQPSFPNSAHLGVSLTTPTPRMSYPNSDHFDRDRSNLLAIPNTLQSDLASSDRRLPENSTNLDSVRVETPAHQTFTISSMHLDRLRSGLPANVDVLRAPPINRQQSIDVPSYQSIAVAPTRLTNDADSPPSYFEVVKDAQPHDLPPPYNPS